MSQTVLFGIFLLVDNLMVLGFNFYFLQVGISSDSPIKTDPINLLIAGLTGVTTALVTIFLLYRKEIKERAAQSEKHASDIKGIYDSVVKETNTNIINNNNLTEEHIDQTKELKNAITALPDKLREILKDRR